MQYGIAFAPLVPSLVLWIAIAAIVVIAGLLLLGRARGAAVRVTALALIVQFGLTVALTVSTAVVLPAGGGTASASVSAVAARPA